MISKKEWPRVYFLANSAIEGGYGERHYNVKNMVHSMRNVLQRSIAAKNKMQNPSEHCWTHLSRLD